MPPRRRLVRRPGRPLATSSTRSLATNPASGAAVQRLLRQRVDLPTGHPEPAALRVSGIGAGLPLARWLAARYRGRGVPLEDLHQVAALALVKAVDGYDPTRQTAFTSYAVPTILGALKHHFRDTAWQLQVPRRVQGTGPAHRPALCRPDAAAGPLTDADRARRTSERRRTGCRHRADRLASPLPQLAGGHDLRRWAAVSAVHRSTRRYRHPHRRDRRQAHPAATTGRVTRAAATHPGDALLR